MVRVKTFFKGGLFMDYVTHPNAAPCGVVVGRDSLRNAVLINEAGLLHVIFRPRSEGEIRLAVPAAADAWDVDLSNFF